MVADNDEWIETHTTCDPATIPWERIRAGLKVMGIHDADDIVELRLAEGKVTLSRIRRATRVDPREQVIKVVHE